MKLFSLVQFALQLGGGMANSPTAFTFNAHLMRGRMAHPNRSNPATNPEGAITVPELVDLIEKIHQTRQKKLKLFRKMLEKVQTFE